MLEISNYTHAPLDSIYCYDTFSMTIYSKVSNDKKEDVTHLKTIKFSERDLYIDDSILIDAMVSAIESMNVFDQKITHVDLKESTLSDFIEYEFDEEEENKIFDGSCFLVTLDPEENCKSRNVQMPCETDAPENFFLSISRTSDGEAEYNKERQQWKTKNKELRERFTKDAMQEYNIEGSVLGFLTRRINIEPSTPSSVESAIRILDEYRKCVTDAKCSH